MAFSQKLNTAREEYFEIVPNKKVNSSIWNHFGFLKENDGPVDKTRVACKLCPIKMILKYSSNTTNLTDHLQRKQQIFEGEIRVHFRMRKLPRSSKLLIQVNDIFSQAATQLEQSKSNFSCHSTVYSQRSASVQCGSKFRISRQHFLDKALPELYEKKKTELKSNLSEVVAVALTTDGWISHATESYVTITCNHIDKE